MERVFQSQPVESWHLIPATDVIQTLQTSATTGLSQATAQENLQIYGPNVLPDPIARASWRILVSQFTTGPVALLSLAAALSIATDGLADAIVIMGVVLINAIIGYATESHSERIIHSLQGLVQPTAWVMRDGILTELPARDVVLGDLLVLRSGNYVTADARLIDVKQLSVDESALTGESLPVTKTVAPLGDADLPLGDRTNMVYMGTLITAGQGLAVVVATRSYTEMGQIHTLVNQAEIPPTPMERQLDQAGSQLVWLSSAVCGVVFGLGLLRGYGVLPMLKTSISLAVAAVPEGLPAIATSTLALGIREMRHHKVLIRRLDAVETLGSVQALCLDKTGTLTINQMSVVALDADGQQIHIVDGQWRNGSAPIDPQASATLMQLLRVLVLCNESEANGQPDRAAELTGSSTENALLDLAIAAGVPIEELRRAYPLVSIHHRSPDSPMMTTLHVPVAVRDPVAIAPLDPQASPPPPSPQFVAVKGSPTDVLAHCQWWLQAGKRVPLTPCDRSRITTANDQMASQALRVLGVAYRDSRDPAVPPQPDSLIWLGLVGMVDPIRPGTPELMQVFHQAGIDTIMLTGDQRSTAYAIGQALHLHRDRPLQILEAPAIAQLAAEGLPTVCEQTQIFARISPAHKLQIIQALQRTGRVVAMTGDGMNDAPALKAANVGVAMGHQGTDVAREVADVVLEDDNLHTLAIAMSRGRTIYNNIRKAVHFLLSTNLSEILVMLTATLLGLGQPLNAIQLLWLNLVTDIFPGLALALDPPDPEVLQQPPRDPQEPVLQPRDLRRIVLESTVLSVSALAAYGYAIHRYGIGSHASTIGFMSLTCAQLFHALSCRSKTRRWSQSALPPNPYLTVALIGSLALQFLPAIVPGLQTLLHITPIRLLDGCIIGISALLPLVINEASKPSHLHPLS